MRYKFVLSYDGKNYYGSQKQIKLPTIQGQIEKALKCMLQYSVSTNFASRTDKGVHANFQVFSIEIKNDIDLKSFKIGINKRLPEDIRINSISKVNDDFHARHSCMKKRYYYEIYKKEENVFLSNYGVYIKDLDYKLFKKAILSFNGKHDFKGFSKENKDKKTVKDLKVKIKKSKKGLRIYFTSRSFLKQMIRILIGSAILVGLKKVKLEDILKNFDTLKRDRANFTAPSKGLFLDYIYY